MVYTKFWGVGSGESGSAQEVKVIKCLNACMREFISPPTPLTPYGSTQRSSALIRLINSSTPLSSGTFLISSLPRYKEM